MIHVARTVQPRCLREYAATWTAEYLRAIAALRLAPNEADTKHLKKQKENAEKQVPTWRGKNGSV